MNLFIYFHLVTFSLINIDCSSLVSYFSPEVILCQICASCYITPMFFFCCENQLHYTIQHL